MAAQGHPRNDRLPGRRAFTIIELVMVLALVGLLAGIAIPRLNTARLKADGAGRLVRMLVMNAQRTSITRQSNTILSVDMTNHRIRVVEDYNNNDTLNTSDRVLWRGLPEGVKFAPPTMGRITGGSSSSAFAGSDLRTVSSYSSIIFRRDGSASSDGEIYFTSRIGVPTEYRGLLISPSTGRTDLYRYSGTAWVLVTK